MSFATYFNEHSMTEPRLLGSFDHAETGAHFEYSMRPAGDRCGVCPEYPHRVFVNDLNGYGDRAAIVKKTVAYVIVNEDGEGKPIIEKWAIKRHQPYQ